MTDERRLEGRRDPATGAELASHRTAERILDEGFVLVDDVVYAASHSGLISAVDLASGAVEKITRIANAPVLARGTAFAELLVFADLAGTVHAVAGGGEGLRGSRALSRGTRARGSRCRVRPAPPPAPPGSAARTSPGPVPSAQRGTRGRPTCRSRPRAHRTAAGRGWSPRRRRPSGCR